MTGAEPIKMRMHELIHQGLQRMPYCCSVLGEDWYLPVLEFSVSRSLEVGRHQTFFSKVPLASVKHMLGVRRQC